MASTAVKADGGLTVRFARDGGVGGVRLGGRKLAVSGPGGFSVVEALAPDGQLRDHGPVRGRVAAAGAIRFEGAIRQAAIELSATVRGGRFIDIAGEVRDLSGVDRALNVSFALPLKLAGWRWENTAATARTVEPGQAYPSKPDDFIYLGKKGDGFADEDPGRYGIRTNKLPFNAVCRGQLGLSMAYPVHEPRVFLLTAGDAGLTVTFSLGVTPITRRFPSRASFRFILLAIDGRWGIRSACQRYMGFFPEFYRTRARRHGNVESVYNPELRPPPEHLEDFGIAYIENDYQRTGGELPEPALRLARSIGVGPEDIFHWRGPWYWFHEAPGDITRDAQLALIRAQAQGRAKGAHGANNQLCGCPNELSARAAYNSYLEDHQGKLERITFQYPQYSCWLLPMNMDPNLPRPNRGSLATDWQYRYIKRWKEKGFRGPFGIAWDAFDDFSGFRRLNFRRQHLAVMDTPATFDPASGRVCQVKGFTDCPWARRQSKLAWNAGGKVMANVNVEHAMMFGGQFIDVVFRERRPDDHDDERLSVHRMLLGPKPICFPGGRRSPKTARAWIGEARRLLTFAMPPGVAEARWKELKAIMPLFERVGGAGWRPVPYARAAGLWIERYGDRPGRLYLAIRNPGSRPVRGRLQIDLGGLGLERLADKIAVRQVSPEGPLRLAATGGRLVGQIAVPASETVIVALERRARPHRRREQPGVPRP